MLAGAERYPLDYRRKIVIKVQAMRIVIWILLGIYIAFNLILAVICIINEYILNTTPHDEIDNSLESFLRPAGTGYAGFVIGAIL